MGYWGGAVAEPEQVRHPLLSLDLQPDEGDSKEEWRS